MHHLHHKIYTLGSTPLTIIIILKPITTARIENRIEQECNQEDKLEIKELLEETKEIIDNMKKNGSIGQRKSFFKRLTDHACKYGWLYAEIVNLIGNAAIGIIGGK